MKKCEWCQVVFKPARKEQRFCSNQCASKYNASKRDYTGSRNPNFGKLMSEENRQKLREAHTGTSLTPEVKAKLSAARLGKEKPAKWRRAISKSLTNNPKVRNDGVLNPNYKHGEYVQDRVYRELIDVSRCSSCGITDKPIVIHHIDGNHRNHRRGNIIPMCLSCHAKLHHPKGKQFGPKKGETNERELPILR